MHQPPEVFTNSERMAHFLHILSMLTCVDIKDFEIMLIKCCDLEMPNNFYNTNKGLTYVDMN